MVMYAQQRFGELWAAPILPAMLIVIKSIGPPFILRFTSFVELSAASCAGFPFRMESQALFAKTSFAAISPILVAEEALVSLSAYVRDICVRNAFVAKIAKCFMQNGS